MVEVETFSAFTTFSLSNSFPSQFSHNLMLTFSSKCSKPFSNLVKLLFRIKFKIGLKIEAPTPINKVTSMPVHKSKFQIKFKFNFIITY